MALSDDIRPMEARSVETIPVGPQWQYEPKWDGFRCLLMRSGGQVALLSKSGQPLARYFPDIVAAAKAVGATEFILDGELVVQTGRSVSFDALLQRIHPAKSRVDRLSQETPATFIAFDLLGERKPLLKEPLTSRRKALEAFARKHFKRAPSFRLSPATRELREAKAWFARAGDALDGIIAKRVDQPYASGERTPSMVKIKNYRSADCVVGGFRYNTGTKVVGSLLLGLYDKKGLLHHVGFTSNLKVHEKPALTKKLERLIAPPGFTGDKPGGPSRWNSKRSAEWNPLRPELVVEVSYDHFNGGRFRHGTSLLRWRPDKAPAQCTMDQLKQKRANLESILS